MLEVMLQIPLYSSLVNDNSTQILFVDVDISDVFCRFLITFSGMSAEILTPKKVDLLFFILILLDTLILLCFFILTFTKSYFD